MARLARMLGIDRSTMTDTQWVDNGPGWVAVLLDDPDAVLARDAPYIARQGSALGRSGRVHITQDPDGTVWAGGGTVTCIRGEVDLAETGT